MSEQRCSRMKRSTIIWSWMERKRGNFWVKRSVNKTINNKVIIYREGLCHCTNKGIPTTIKNIIGRNLVIGKSSFWKNINAHLLLLHKPKVLHIVMMLAAVNVTDGCSFVSLSFISCSFTMPSGCLLSVVTSVCQ